MNKHGQLWTPQETELAIQLMDEGADDAKCQAILGRSRQGCKDRIRHCKDSFGNIKKSGYSVSTKEIPQAVIDDRNRRLMARKSLTGMLMGDPPFPAEKRFG